MTMRAPLMALLFAVAALCCAADAVAATVQSAGDNASLQAALKAAQPGDVIKVTSPVHSVFLGAASFDPPVTVDLGAQPYDGLMLGNAKGLIITGGAGAAKNWTGCIYGAAPTNLTIRSSGCARDPASVGVTAGFTFKGAPTLKGSNITIIDNNFSGLGVTMINVDGFAVTANNFFRSGDGMDFGGATHGLVNFNVCIASTKTDNHNDCGQGEKPVPNYYPVISYITFEDNFCQNFTQCFGFYNGGDHLIIRRNRARISQYQGIALGAVTNSDVEDNDIETLAAEDPPGRATINAKDATGRVLVGPYDAPTGNTLCNNRVRPFGFAKAPIYAAPCLAATPAPAPAPAPAAP